MPDREESLRKTTRKNAGKPPLIIQLKRIELRRLEALKAIKQKEAEAARAAEMRKVMEIEEQIINIQASMEVEQVSQNSSVRSSSRASINSSDIEVPETIQAPMENNFQTMTKGNKEKIRIWLDQVNIENHGNESMDNPVISPLDSNSVPEADSAERDIILGLESDQSIDDFFQDIGFLRKSKDVCESSISELLDTSRAQATPWEVEIREFCLERIPFKQEEIIKKMNDALKDFDDRHENLNNERAEPLVGGLFCDLSIHRLHQELIILRDFEAHQEVLREKVFARMTSVLDMEDMINGVKSQNGAMEKNLEQQDLIHEQFYKLIHDNKFSKFLKNVFKKKQKPPKVPHGDDSSSKSSSYSS